MSGFVMDCSIASAWLFEDEANPRIDAILGQLQLGGAFVPNLWHLELGNFLIQVQRRGRITAIDLMYTLFVVSTKGVVENDRTIGILLILRYLFNSNFYFP